MEYKKVKEILEHELGTLIKRRSNCINTQSDKQAIDISRLIKDTIDLINKLPDVSEDWETMTSCYGMIRPEFSNVEPENLKPDEHFASVIAVWEQNSEGKIRNHKIYERGNQIL